MADFLEETLDMLADNGKTIEDIEWIGTPDLELTWDEFEVMASGEEDLDTGREGLVPVPTDLKIVGSDWWMELTTEESFEYDESISWEYREKPVRPIPLIKSEKEELHKEIMNAETPEFSIAFGDNTEEFAEVVFNDTDESISK